MNNMKRLVAVMLVLTIALCFIACTGNDTPTTTQKPEPTDPTTSSTTLPTSSTTQPTNPATPSHTVIVVDQDGNPVAGVYVQLCDESACYAPVATDENGVAEFYKHGIVGAMTKVIVADGYLFSNEYTVFGDSTTVTLTVTAETE